MAQMSPLGADCSDPVIKLSLGPAAGWAHQRPPWPPLRASGRPGSLSGGPGRRTVPSHTACDPVSPELGVWQVCPAPPLDRGGVPSRPPPDGGFGLVLVGVVRWSHRAPPPEACNGEPVLWIYITWQMANGYMDMRRSVSAVTLQWRSEQASSRNPTARGRGPSLLTDPWHGPSGPIVYWQFRWNPRARAGLATSPTSDLNHTELPA